MIVDEEYVSLADISIRTLFQPGDIGYVVYLHGALYGKEYNYGIQFETYVAKGLCEFYEKYDPIIIFFPINRTMQVHHVADMRLKECSNRESANETIFFIYDHLLINLYRDLRLRLLIDSKVFTRLKSGFPNSSCGASSVC